MLIKKCDELYLDCCQVNCMGHASHAGILGRKIDATLLASWLKRWHKCVVVAGIVHYNRNYLCECISWIHWIRVNMHPPDEAIHFQGLPNGLCHILTWMLTYKFPQIDEKFLCKGLSKYLVYKKKNVHTKLAIVGHKVCNNHDGQKRELIAWCPCVEGQAYFALQSLLWN